MTSSHISEKHWTQAINESTLNMPAAIVMNLFYSGMGIVRQLSKYGVKVVGLSADPHIYGNFTKLCEVRRAPSSQDESQQLLPLLLNLASELNGAVIFPTCDADVRFLNDFRGELQEFFHISIPDRKVLQSVMDKHRLFNIAKLAGLAIPTTIKVSGFDELPEASKVVGLPCVIKPVSSIHWREHGNWAIVGGRKAFRAETLQDLQGIYQRVSKVNPEVLVQGWIPGETTQLHVWGGYLDHNSEPLGWFTARKVVQSPEQFGTGCIVESDLIPELLDPSLRLCRALGHQGMTEIEYKLDARDGKHKLIELNPRHWDWHQLGEASGVNLSWIAYRHMSGMSVDTKEPDLRKMKWIAEDAFLARMLADVSEGKLSNFRHVLGARIFGIFSLRDPMPFLRYFIATVVPSLFYRLFQKTFKNSERKGQPNETPDELTLSKSIGVSN